MKILVVADVIYIMMIVYDMHNQRLRCHRRNERSYKFMRNQKWRVCSRCFSMYLGIAFFPLTFKLFYTYPLYLLLPLIVFMQVPMLADGISQKKTKRVSNNFLRTVTGLISGLGLSLVVVVIVRVINFISM